MSEASSVAATLGTVAMTVGYTDPLIGLAEWPSTTAGWTVQALTGGAGATLIFRISMQAAGLLPSGTASGASAAAGAADIASRFAAIWYQIVQPDMQLSLATSLNQPAGAPPTGLPVAINGLRSHVAGCYAFCNAAAMLGTMVADPATTPTLAQVVTHYGVDWQALGLAAGERPCGAILTIPLAGLAIPRFAVFAAGGTVADLVPSGLDPAQVLGDDDNIALPLLPGTELVVPGVDRVQPESGLSLNALAQRLNITAASLVRANAAQPALLAPNFVFVAQGVEVEVPAEGQAGADVTLDGIARTFQNNGVPFDAVMAAVANGDAPGMFRPTVALMVDRQIIAPGWSLAANGTGVPAATLASVNVDTVDLFPAGTPLFLQTTLATGLEHAPLGALARAYAIEPGDLLRHNAAVAPAAPDPAGNGFPVPGLASLPSDPTLVRIPYRVPGGLSLTQIAARFASAAPAGAAVSPEAALADANRAMPATLAPDQTISVAGQSLRTQAGDSFDALIGRADPPVTLAEFAAAIADNAAALAKDALLLCPPAKPWGDAPLSPSAIAQLYGLDPVLLFSANVATAGMIFPGVPLKPSPIADAPSVTTTAADSLNAILRRFAIAGASVTLGDVIQGNLDTPFLAPGALLLLPPADTLVSAVFGNTGWQLPDVIFPVRASMTLTRDRTLVDPCFRGPVEAPGPVVQAVSLIAATRSAAPDRREDGAYTLDLLAAALEAAIPGLKLATGRVLTGASDPAPTDLWAVSFVDPGGIAQVRIEPTETVEGAQGLQPLSFALRPLSNTLESKSRVEICPLDPATGQWGPPEIRDYQGIDLEVWARAWIAGLDLICTAPYAAPAYRIAPAALELLLEAKKRLACAIADGLSAILVTQAANDGAIGGRAWRAARDVLHERLLARLGQAYDTTAILQFKATVAAPSAVKAAKLVGAGQLRDLDPELGARVAATGAAADAWKVSQLSNAKVTLTATEPDAPATVSFLVDVSQPARHRSVTLEPMFAVNEIEFNIAPIVDGYAASNWLSFVRPFDRFAPPAFQALLGTPVTPVPLRAYPELPALVSQVAEPNPDPKTPAEALLWTYVFTYAHQSAAQDQIRIEIEFNRRPTAARLELTDDTLFAKLAQYAAASDTLWPILGTLEHAEGPGSDPVLANALASYATLAADVAAAWSAWWGIGTCEPTVAQSGKRRAAHVGLVPPTRRATPGADGAPKASAPHEFYHYLATLNAELIDGTDIYTSLTLKRLDADGDVAWPAIAVIREDGRILPLSPPVATGEPGDATKIYSFPLNDPLDHVPAFTRLGFRWSIPQLHIATYQNAASAVSVIRNAHLLGAGAAETCTAFVYSTRQLGFPEPLVPLITVSDHLSIGTWTDDPATNPLNALFDILFDHDPADRDIAVAILYGYTLVASDPPLEVYEPLGLRPRFRFGTDTVSSIIAAVDDWRQRVLPTTKGAILRFQISLYSSNDPALDRPLVELQFIVSPIA